MSTATKARPTAAGGSAANDAEGEAPARGGKKKIVMIAVVLLVVAAAAAWFFLFRGKSAEAAEEPAPVPGAVLTMDSISVNLASSHYLRIGIALQLTEEATAHEPDGSQALDLTIATFSGQDPAVLADPAQRDALKAQLLTAVEEAYHDGVMDIYFTEFVTQ